MPRPVVIWLHRLGIEQSGLNGLRRLSLGSAAMRAANPM
jgi:hypothetical protein